MLFDQICMEKNILRTAPKLLTYIIALHVMP